MIAVDIHARMVLLVRMLFLRTIVTVLQNGLVKICQHICVICIKFQLSSVSLLIFF